MSVYFPAPMITGLPFDSQSRRYLQLADGAELVGALVGHPLAVALPPEDAEALALVVGLSLGPVTELALVDLQGCYSVLS